MKDRTQGQPRSDAPGRAEDAAPRTADRRFTDQAAQAHHGRTLDGLVVDGTATGIHAVALGDRFLSPSQLWGPPAKYAHERTIEGVVSQDLFPQIVETIRREMKSRGRFAVREDALDWSSELEIVHISVESHGTRTIIHVVGDASWDLIATYGVALLLVGAVIVGAWVKSADGVGLGFAAAFLVGGVVAARMTWQMIAARFRRKLSNLLTILDRRLKELAEA